MNLRLIAWLPFLFSPLSANQESDELLAAFQTCLESGDDIGELTESLAEKDGKTLDDLLKSVDQAWPSVRDRYLSALESAAKKGMGKDRNTQKGRIRELRAEFMEIYQMGEGAMKPLLKSKSMPALKELKKRIDPTSEELLESAPDDLRLLRQTAIKLARLRDAAMDAAISTELPESVSNLESREQEIAAEAGGFSRTDLKILAKNRDIAERNDIPEDEARGIEECNRWRIYVGLKALELDPKLCEASRDHSTDMATEGFFAHESPVKGKKTPWDRAKNFGTTASGENIYAGGSDPHGANTGWFYSPGHHKNMFGGGHSRIGLGHHQGRWTQMFGN